MTVHAVDVLDTEASSENGDFNLLAKFNVCSKSPLDFEIVAELCHKVVDIVHLLHHQRLLTIL